MHTFYRLGGHRTGNADFLFGILRLKLKAANHSRHRAPEFSTGKVFADASSLAVKKCDL
jgi:hypothetical protein